MKNLKLFVLVFIAALFTLNTGSAYAVSASLASTATTTQTGKININTADANLLASTLKGIGLKKAQAIILHRETYGDFINLQELQEVKGIGPATVQKNAHLVGVE